MKKLLIMAMVFIVMGFATWQVIRYEQRLAERAIDAVFVQEATDTEAKAEVEEPYPDSISISSGELESKIVYAGDFGNIEPTQEEIYNSMRDWGILNPEDCIDGSMLIWDTSGPGVECFTVEDIQIDWQDLSETTYLSPEEPYILNAEDCQAGDLIQYSEEREGLICVEQKEVDEGKAHRQAFEDGRQEYK